MTATSTKLEQWKRFAEAYAGVAAGDQGEAARIAGFKGRTPESLSEIGRRTLKRPEVQAHLEELAKASPLVKDGEALRAFWSSVVEGKTFTEVKAGRKVKNTPPMKERIKASELLAKASGMFIKKVEVEHSGRVSFVAELPSNGRDDGT